MGLFRRTIQVTPLVVTNASNPADWRFVGFVAGISVVDYSMVWPPHNIDLRDKIRVTWLCYREVMHAR